MAFKHLLTIFFVALLLVNCKSKSVGSTGCCQCILGNDLIAEIQSYTDIRDEVLQYVLEGNFKGRTYTE